MHLLTETLMLRQLVAKLLAVESGQNAIIQNKQYRRKDKKVVPYNYTTAEFTAATANLRNSYTGAVVTEGIAVAEALGAEGMITRNILANDVDSVAYTSVPDLEMVVPDWRLGHSWWLLPPWSRWHHCPYPPECWYHCTLILLVWVTMTYISCCSTSCKFP